MIVIHWVLNGTGKWHAWPNGGRRTYCGRLTMEHLRLHSATQISADIPTGKLCTSCVKKSGVLIEPTTAAWVEVLRHYLRRSRIKVDNNSIEQLAALLAEEGSPDEVAAREVFEEVQQLLLKPTWSGNHRHLSATYSLPHLKEALTKLPLNTGALTRVATTVRAWRTITNRKLNTENFRSERVIEIMLQIPSPEPYIRHLNARGLPHLAAMFHPNTLERAKKEPTLRGLFAGSNTYWDNTASQLNIISD